MLLVGASVGGIVVLAAALIVGIMLVRRQTQKRQVKSQTPPTKGREVIHEIHHGNPLRKPSIVFEGGCVPRILGGRLYSYIEGTAQFVFVT